MSSPINDFLAFCYTDTGTNLLEQSAYASDPQLAIGNQPGIARSQLVNKALRQATYVASCVAQFLANSTGNNVLDDATQSEILATMLLAFRNPPTVQIFTTSGTYTTPATAAWLEVLAWGGGAGGGGSSNTSSFDGTAGGNGGNTTFASLLSAGGGQGGSDSRSGGLGGTFSFTSPAYDFGNSTAGNPGSAAQATNTPLDFLLPGAGGLTLLGGGSASVLFPAGNAGYAPAANTGSGGSGGSSASASGSATGGGGGGAGAFARGVIPATLSSTYSVTIGAAGSAGTAGTNGFIGGAGAAGKLVVIAHYGC